MINRVKVSIAIILILLLSSNVYAHKATFINSGENRYKSIRLTEKILNMTDENLSSLTLKNEKEEEIPYFIKVGDGEDSNYKIGNMEFMNYYAYGDDEYFNYEHIVNEENKKIEKLRIYVNGDDVKGAEIYGSHDNVEWDNVGETTLYKTDSENVINIPLDKEVEEYNFFRVRIIDGVGSMGIDRVEYYIREEYQEEEDSSIENIEAEFYMKGTDNKSLLTIKNMKNLKIHSIELGVKNKEIFNRNVSTEDGMVGEDIYNDNSENAEDAENKEPSRDTTIDMWSYQSRESDLKLIISDKDDKPLEIEYVKVKYYVQEMVFDGQDSKEFTLFFNEEPVKSKEYDISRFEEKIVNEDIDRLELKDISLGDEGAEHTKTQSNIFNVVVVAIGIMMLVIIVKNFKKA